MDFDTGNPTSPGEYRLTDETYAKLLDKLTKTKFAGCKPDLRQNILTFYQNPSAPNYTKKKREEVEQSTAAVRRIENNLKASKSTGNASAAISANWLIEE